MLKELLELLPKPIVEDHPIHDASEAIRSAHAHTAHAFASHGTPDEEELHHNAADEHENVSRVLNRLGGQRKMADWHGKLARLHRAVANRPAPDTVDEHE